MKIRCLVVAFLVLPSLPLGAVSVAIANHSFEADAIADGTFDTSATTPPAGWSIVGSLSNSPPVRHVGILNPNTTTLYPGGAPDGNNVGVVFLNDQPFADDPAGLAQTLSETLALNTIYTLTLDVGNIANDPNPPHNQFDFAGFPGYSIELLAGTTVIASESNAVTPGEGLFEERTIAVTTNAAQHTGLVGQSLTIRLMNLNAAPGVEVNFDDVRLDATIIPEPSLGMLAFVATALLAWRRSRNAPLH